MPSKSVETIVSWAKRRGFVYPGSEIYGGLANTWDYGPYGAQLKKNIVDFWWKTFIENRDDILPMDSAILMNPRVWEASGHAASFSDPLMDCKKCQERARGDKLLEENLEMVATGKSNKEILDLIMQHKIACPHCGAVDWTEPRSFNLMFKTYQGVIEDQAAQIYLRPETAQGMFVNFKNILDSNRVRLPFGLGQVGKSFRNEITPGNFTFRTREFEQMEIEYFIKPEDAEKTFEQWKKDSWDFFLNLGISPERLRIRPHEEDELSHYSNMTVDIEYEFPFGWGELQGIAYRGSFDLEQHRKFSGAKLEYRDPMTQESFVPHTVEPAWGLTRTMLTVLIEAYDEEVLEGGETRVVLHFDPKIAPVQIAIFPLHKKLEEEAEKLYKDLKPHFRCEYDDSGAIGKRYRRQDEIGTPFCVTLDFDSLEDHCVTVRDRDSMSQKRVPMAELKTMLFTSLS